MLFSLRKNRYGNHPTLTLRDRSGAKQGEGNLQRLLSTLANFAFFTREMNKRTEESSPTCHRASRLPIGIPAAVGQNPSLFRLYALQRTLEAFLKASRSLSPLLAVHLRLEDGHRRDVDDVIYIRAWDQKIDRLSHAHQNWPNRHGPSQPRQELVGDVR